MIQDGYILSRGLNSVNKWPIQSVFHHEIKNELERSQGGLVRWGGVRLPWDALGGKYGGAGVISWTPGLPVRAEEGAG